MAANLYTQQSNNIAKTWLLMIAFIALVSGLGYLFSEMFASPIILIAAVIFSLGMNIYAYWNSDKVAIRQAKAVPADPQEFRDLHNMVENLAITAGLPKPKLFIINDSALNAFATGRNPDNSAIAVTTGLLNALDKNEVEGVIAHEMAHIGNRDILVMTIAIVLSGFVALLADFLLRGSMFGGGNDNRGALFSILIGIGAAILAQVFATLLQLAVSRRREYLADATGALMTRYPEGLASALEKISGYSAPMKTASKATAHMYISQPFGARKKLSGLFATHPPMEKRIAALRGLQI